MKLNSLLDLYIEELRDIYNAETQLVDKLPKMIDRATTPNLKTAIQKHYEETKLQVARLERIFEGLEVSPKGETSEAMKGLLKEGKDVIKADGDPTVIDAALIVAVQRAEHYEIAAYGALCTFAELLNRPADKELLGQTLNEEKTCDQSLNEIARDIVNPQAAAHQPPRHKAA